MDARGMPRDLLPDEVLAAERALVEVWAPWCLYSRLLQPKTLHLAREYGGGLTVGRLDADRHAATVAALGIEYVPAIVLLERGAPRATWYGDTPLDLVIEGLDGHV